VLLDNELWQSLTERAKWAAGACAARSTLAISKIGAPRDQTAVSSSGLFGPADSVSLPGASGYCSVGGVLPLSAHRPFSNWNRITPVSVGLCFVLSGVVLRPGRM